jgi:hypothetical protein
MGRMTNEGYHNHHLGPGGLVASQPMLYIGTSGGGKAGAIAAVNYPKFRMWAAHHLSALFLR